ncbi:MAG TPA: DUF4142 domain-containing protein [Beijerinckiaceae bacterium]|jgi:predicted outer membrane protein
MHRRSFLQGLLLASAPLAVTGAAVAQTAAPAGAIPSAAYLRMAMAGGMFLEESARLAYERTQRPQLRAFARAEVVEQVGLSRKLGAGAEIPTASTPGAPTGAVLGGAAIGALAGGPVGAVVGAGVGATAGAAAAGGAPMTSDAQKQAMLAQLSAQAAGPQFDALFVQAQIMGHQEALAIHDGYARAGEDPQLRRIARNATPLIRRHLAQLARLQRIG